MRGNHRTAGDSTAANIFGCALKRHRRRLAWSQEDLAEASGVAARTISDLERGVAQQPRSATVRMLAEALGLSSPDDLAAFKAAARASREASLAGDLTPAMPAPAARPGPTMLPRDIESFTGRQVELDRLMTTASTARGSGGVVRVFAVVVGIYAVEEIGGIGEGALALRAAQLVADQFPDGQLFMDLKGYTPGVRPVAPEDALCSPLSALGVTG
jgi:transcriptional regulator with XRE-family HTH domain